MKQSGIDVVFHGREKNEAAHYCSTCEVCDSLIIRDKLPLSRDCLAYRFNGIHHYLRILYDAWVVGRTHIECKYTKCSPSEEQLAL